ncbi:hypothetical protein [Ruixingdingia sedimenti]|uniref:Uncharacterized protein n=1 Tax=Ruixingdingia sedimenti TaxID=3073604 RepID=A0ABU1F6C1_9RHOB|nr:hypothetical protein [Xinfangfangia sp. LG-4]MDR5652153.1 hypothetical protein [Xinfangfangia sp. LG-4]
MEAVLVVLAVLGFFASVAGLIYPFRPFRTRRRALVSVVACLIALPLIAPSSNKTGPAAALATAAVPAEREIHVPSDAQARYVVYDLTRRDDGMVEVSTRREGKSGTSYAVRLVQCAPLRFAYLAEGETREGLVRIPAPELSDLVAGSISDVVSRYACAAPEAQRSAAAPQDAAPAPQSRRDRQRVEDLRKAVAAAQWAEARMKFTALATGDHAGEDLRAELEAAALDFVRPLPASARQANLDGYLFLAAIRPENGTYGQKVDQYRAAIRSDRQQAVAKLRRKEDKVEGVTWFHHPGQPQYLNSRSTAYLYIGRKGENGRPWLRLRVQYTASDWLFVQRVDAWHDGVKEPLVSGGFERDNNSTIWEWVDIAPDAYHLKVLKSLATAREAILRYEGSQYKRDVTLSSGDKRAILDMIAAYEAMRSPD